MAIRVQSKKRIEEKIAGSVQSVMKMRQDPMTSSIGSIK